MEKSFSEALIMHIETSGRSVSEIAAAAGVNRDALYKVRSGKTKNMAVDDAVKVAAAFGKTIEEFMGLNEARVKSELQQQLDLLTDQERALLLGSIKAVVGQRMLKYRERAEGAEEDEPSPEKSSKT